MRSSLRRHATECHLGLCREGEGADPRGSRVVGSLVWSGSVHHLKGWCPDLGAKPGLLWGQIAGTGSPRCNRVHRGDSGSWLQSLQPILQPSLEELRLMTSPTMKIRKMLIDFVIKDNNQKSISFLQLYLHRLTLMN
jgi:hypothetical protein